MNQKFYSGSIALTKLKSALITTKKGTRAIVITIEDNYLVEKDGAVYLPLSLNVKDETNQYGQNGFISQSISSEVYKELGKDKVRELSLPILGNIKNFNNDGANATTIAGTTDPEEDDDLPF